MLDSSDNPDDQDMPRMRIVQYAGRRHAIRIEPPFWDALEDAARESGSRLNRIVAALAQHPSGPRNLTARLRVYAMKRMQRLARRSPLRGGGVDLASIIAAAPVPAFVFTGARTIAVVNPAVETWTGEAAASLEGAPLAQFFRIRFKQPHADPWRALADVTVDRLEGTIAYMPPGRVLVRPIHACRIALDGPPDYACLVFVG